MEGAQDGQATRGIGSTDDGVAHTFANWLCQDLHGAAGEAERNAHQAPVGAVDADAEELLHEEEDQASIAAPETTDAEHDEQAASGKISVRVPALR